MDYHQYLHTPDLLKLQRPLSDQREPETLFIIAHQCSELWLMSILENLSAADQVLLQPDPNSAALLPYLGRTKTGCEMLIHNLDALRSIEPVEFQAFRPYLGTSSGAQSHQFAQLRHLVGLEGPEGGPIEAHLAATLAAEGLAYLTYPDRTTPGPLSPGGGWFAVVAALRDISNTLWRWGVHHLDITHRMITDSAGTGGSSGVTHLARSVLDRPFPSLWQQQPAPVGVPS